MWLCFNFNKYLASAFHGTSCPYLYISNYINSYKTICSRSIRLFLICTVFFLLLIDHRKRMVSTVLTVIFYCCRTIHTNKINFDIERRAMKLKFNLLKYRKIILNYKMDLVVYFGVATVDVVIISNRVWLYFWE